MYAIFENGSKQYKADVGDIVKLEKLDALVGATVTFPVVMTADENGIAAGKEVEGFTVSGEVIAQGKDKKIVVFKYKAKKNERKKQGHRQPYTLIKITAINAAAKKEPDAPVKTKKTTKKTAPATVTAEAEKVTIDAEEKPADNIAVADEATE